jgi:hypothetical protein
MDLIKLFDKLDMQARMDFIIQLPEYLSPLELFALKSCLPHTDIFSALPLEIGHLICEYMDMKDLATMEGVAKRWKGVVDSGMHWRKYAQYHDPFFKLGRYSWKDLAKRIFVIERNWKRGKSVYNFAQRLHQQAITAVHILPPNQYAEHSDTGVLPRTLITASLDRRIRLFTVGGDSGRLSSDSHGSGIYLTWKRDIDTQLPIHAMSIVQQDGKWIAATLHDRHIKMWNLATGQCLNVTEGPSLITHISLHTELPIVFFRTQQSAYTLNYAADNVPIRLDGDLVHHETTSDGFFYNSKDQCLYSKCAETDVYLSWDFRNNGKFETHRCFGTRRMDRCCYRRIHENQLIPRPRFVRKRTVDARDDRRSIGTGSLHPNFDRSKIPPEFAPYFLFVSHRSAVNRFFDFVLLFNTNDRVTSMGLWFEGFAYGNHEGILHISHFHQPLKRPSP